MALDKNSKKFNLKNTTILTTKTQEKRWPKLSRLIGGIVLHEEILLFLMLMKEVQT